MTHLQFSHFSAAIVFSFFASIVFAICQRNTKPEMVRYGMKCFATFLGGIFIAGWVMAGLRYFATR